MQNGRDAAAGIPATLHNTPLTLRLSGGYTRFTRDASPSRGHARRSGVVLSGRAIIFLRILSRVICNPRLHYLAQRIVRRDLVELKRSATLRT